MAIGTLTSSQIGYCCIASWKMNFTWRVRVVTQIFFKTKLSSMTYNVENLRRYAKQRWVKRLKRGDGDTS